MKYILHKIFSEKFKPVPSDSSLKSLDEYNTDIPYSVKYISRFMPLKKNDSGGIALTPAFPARLCLAQWDFQNAKPLFLNLSEVQRTSLSCKGRLFSILVCLIIFSLSSYDLTNKKFIDTILPNNMDVLIKSNTVF